MTPIETTDSGSGPYTGTDPRLEIIEYLHLHPYAADTVDGIIHWWLSRQRYETAKAVIQRALEDLVNQGVIDCVEAADNTRVFRLSVHRKQPESWKNKESE
jgi:Fe2+ or Zn2+ uptake regulation protein